MSRPLLFVHIRKTGGVSVRGLLINRFSVGRILLQAHSVMAAGEDFGRFDLVTGHLDFGALARFRERPVIFTLLRDPVRRALSAFYFFREHDEARFAQLELELSPRDFAERRRFTELAQQMPLLDFLEREPELSQRHLANVQTRHLLSTPRESLDGDSLAEAKRNLESCDVPGLTERLDDSLELLSHRLGWPQLGPVFHYNATQRKPRAEEIEPRAIELLTRWNQIDLQLYAHAVEIFERRLAEAKSRPLEYRIGALPAASDFTFDQPVHGHGWHEREKNGNGWFCWMAREQASLVLRAEGASDSTLRCHVEHAMDPAILSGLRIDINGRPLTTTFSAENSMSIVEAFVPAEALRGPHVHITFSLPRTMRGCEPDRRELGVAFSRIQLAPI